MMHQALILSLAIAASLLSACGGTPECSETRLYQEAVPGKRIEVPDGLSALDARRELSIPSASPQAPPPPGECVDAPPTLRTGSSGDQTG